MKICSVAMEIQNSRAIDRLRGYPHCIKVIAIRRSEDKARLLQSVGHRWWADQRACLEHQLSLKYSQKQ